MKREKTCSYIALDSARSLFLRCLCWRTCGASQYLWIYQLLRVHVLNLHRILYYKLLTNKLHFQLDSGLLTSTNACALANKQINYTFMYWSFTAQQYDATTVCVRNDVLICIVISGLYGWHQTLFYFVSLWRRLQIMGFLDVHLPWPVCLPNSLATLSRGGLKSHNMPLRKAKAVKKYLTLQFNCLSK